MIDLRAYLMYNIYQIKLSFKIAGVMSFGGMMVMNMSVFLDKWMNENIDYVLIALILVALDHALGSVVHQWFKNDFDWKKNIIGLLIKLSMVLCAGLIFEGLTHVTKEQDLVYTYLKMTTRFIICLYPGLSALKNMKIITKGAFPPDALVGKLEGFQKDLDLEKLKKGKENEGD